MYKDGYEWIGYFLFVCEVEDMDEDFWVMVGGFYCKKLYCVSIFNISVMSFGSLLKNVILVLNKGVVKGGFYYNIGEGGLILYYFENGGDIVW